MCRRSPRVLNDQAAAGRITQDTEERIRRWPAGSDIAATRSPAPFAPVARSWWGWLCPTWPTSTRPGITRGAGDVLYAHGYSLILASTDDDPKHAESQVSAMLGVQVDGLLYGVAREDDPVLAGSSMRGSRWSCSIAGRKAARSAPSSPTTAPGPGWRWSTCSPWVIATSCTSAGRRTSHPPSIGSGPSRRRSETAGLTGHHALCPPSDRGRGLPGDD